MRPPAPAPGQLVIGVSGDFHDAAACVLVDGVVVAAAEEERFTREKHDPSLPFHAVAWCLDHVGASPGDVAAVAFHEKPFTAYERIVRSFAEAGPRSLGEFTRAVSSWTRSKLWVRSRLERLLEDLGHRRVPVLFSEHHLSHAASAYYPSPFDDAAVLTVDGVGEWSTSSIGHGRVDQLLLHREMRYPNSVGLLYSTMTAHCGFAVNDGEYKLMGLAPYGEPRFVDALLDDVVRIHADGSIHLDPRRFRFGGGRSMGSPSLATVLEGPPLPLGAEPGQREADIAASTQAIVEEIVLAMAAEAHRLTGSSSLCLAGGVALNCVANRRLRAEGPFEEVWVQPAAGDAGGALGAAWWAWHMVMEQPRAAAPHPDGMQGMALGPSFGHGSIRRWLEHLGVDHVVVDEDALHRTVAESLADGAIVGWFRGRMEFGPRALGHRSILADPRSTSVASDINQKVKGREGFRPFAPAVLAEEAHAWFDIDGPSPYMTFTARVAQERWLEPVGPSGRAAFPARLAQVRSTVPAVTHVDRSARVQVVDREVSPDFHRLLRSFFDRTGCPVLLNTSFNRAGEPIVRSPADALRTARAARLDLLVLEGCVIDPSRLPPAAVVDAWADA